MVNTSYEDVFNKIAEKAGGHLSPDSKAYYCAAHIHSMIEGWLYRFNIFVIANSHTIAITFYTPDYIDVFQISYSEKKILNMEPWWGFVIECGTIGDKELFNKYAEKSKLYVKNKLPLEIVKECHEESLKNGFVKL